VLRRNKDILIWQLAFSPSTPPRKHLGSWSSARGKIARKWYLSTIHLAVVVAAISLPAWSVANPSRPGITIDVRHADIKCINRRCKGQIWSSVRYAIHKLISRSSGKEMIKIDICYNHF
jgi:hypothetical protein